MNMKPPPDRSLQLLLTAVFATLLFLWILFNMTSCAARPERTFSRPKYEVATRTGPAKGRAAVRQSWFQRGWFWQKQRTQDPFRP